MRTKSQFPLVGNIWCTRPEIASASEASGEVDARPRASLRSAIPYIVYSACTAVQRSGSTSQLRTRWFTHGNAVMSKFPIVYDQNHDCSIAGPEKRGLLHCVLRVPGQASDVHVICVHLGLVERHRQQQLDLLCEMVRGEVPDNAPLVVAGDFNDWRRRADRVLGPGVGLSEVFVTAYGLPAKTFPAHFPLFCLDRIYVRNASVHLPVVLPRKPWSHLSDHAPLAAEIHL